MFKDVTKLVKNLSGVMVIGVGVLAANNALGAIADTKHNLSASGGGVNSFSGTEEICVFCHTPHGSDTSASVPLWNRVLPLGDSYQTYDSLGTSTLDGSVSHTVGSVSIACLSCHDGTTAMDVMINAPTDPTTGASNYSPSGIRITGSWTGPASATDGQLNYDSIAFIDTDLRNDHPIGIQYAGGGITATNHADNTTFAGVMGDPDFNAPYKATINGNAVWWVDVDADGIRDKTDMQLYTRNDLQYAADGTSLGINEPSVECASCHNPHTSETATFLRMANTGSALCLACHVK